MYAEVLSSKLSRINDVKPFLGKFAESKIESIDRLPWSETAAIT